MHRSAIVLQNWFIYTTVCVPKMKVYHFYTPPQKNWRGIMLYPPNRLSVRPSALRFRTLT